jgi:predicted transcriptional regulator of viral defense system
MCYNQNRSFRVPFNRSHWSALHFHGLTEQIPRECCVLTTKGVNVPET